MDGKAQILLAMCVLLIVAAVIVKWLGNSGTANLIALISAILGGLFGAAAVVRSMTGVRTQGPEL